MVTDGETLARDLRRLGLTAGDTVLVHSSLRAVGPVPGGAATVVRALLDVLGPAGTLAVYTQSPDNSDPSRWPWTRGYSAPEGTWDALRAAIPPYDPERTPSRHVGVLPEVVRTWPGALRSAHPQTSFAAVGANAGKVVGDHAPDCVLGERSPLARLEELDAKVLLMGVGYGVCTAFHLAEYRLPSCPSREYGCAVSDVPGGRGRRWYRYTDLALDASDFAALGQAFEARPAEWAESRSPVTIATVGRAESRLLDLASAVRFAVGWMRVSRGRASG